MPLCRSMGNGLWEIRTDLTTKRTARVLLCLYREHLVLLHGFIKKTGPRLMRNWQGAKAPEGVGAMSKKNMGTSVDDFLREEVIFAVAPAQAIKEVVAWQLEEKENFQEQD